MWAYTKTLQHSTIAQHTYMHKWVLCCCSTSLQSIRCYVSSETANRLQLFAKTQHERMSSGSQSNASLTLIQVCLASAAICFSQLLLYNRFIELCGCRKALLSARRSTAGRTEFDRADLLEWGLSVNMGTPLSLQVC